MAFKSTSAQQVLALLRILTTTAQWQELFDYKLVLSFTHCAFARNSTILINQNSAAVPNLRRVVSPACMIQRRQQPQSYCTCSRHTNPRDIPKPHAPARDSSVHPALKTGKSCDCASRDRSRKNRANVRIHNRQRRNRHSRGMSSHSCPRARSNSSGKGNSLRCQ